MGALKPTVSGIGFYLHKELGAAEVGILSTQKMSRGRDLDFIYATNSARPGSDFIYTHDFIYTPLPTRLAVYPHSQAKGRPVSLAGSSQSRLGCSPTDATTCRLRVPRISARAMPPPDLATESSLRVTCLPRRHQTRGCRANDDLTHSPTPVHPPRQAPPEI